MAGIVTLEETSNGYSTLGASHSPASADCFALNWLPDAPDWSARIANFDRIVDVAEAWSELVALASTRMDFIRVGRLDRAFLRRFGALPQGLTMHPLRLALLSSSTLAHLTPSLRIAAVRRGIWLGIYECGYGQYFQELSDPGSPLHAFAPDAVLLSLDAEHLTRGLNSAADSKRAETVLQESVVHLQTCWRLAREGLRCQVIQQTALPVFSALLGNNEHRLPGSKNRLISELNHALRPAADAAGIDLLAIDARVAHDGLNRWHDPVIWHRAKQEISPAAAPFYGDLVGRMLAARQGRSFKCLVLDLDNTLWGGVIGDDGLDGIVLGQGGTLGEAFVAFQRYVLALSQRGVILAVCSKNDESVARSVFTSHPEMVLKLEDIACFVANWSDKPSNLRDIALRLNIGLDALVFVDDNPFERAFVRRELPMVATPEIPDDPALFADCLADAGYFESLSVTDEDRERTRLYHANAERETLHATVGDLPSFLRSLSMDLVWQRFDSTGLRRIVQLINKTNQFNLTTRRYTEDEVLAVMRDPRVFGLQFRLIDRFGDNGIIAIVICRLDERHDVLLDTWLMSCRVLGRTVEEATLGVVAAEARRIGARRLVGEYRPTPKNGLVEAHYPKLGFMESDTGADGSRRYLLELESHVSPEPFMTIRQG